MQASTVLEPLHTLSLRGPFLRVCRIDVFPDRVVVDRRRPGGRPRRIAIELTHGLGAVIAEDWRLVGRPGGLGRLRPTTYSVEYGGRLVVAAVRSLSDAERVARTINSVTRPDAG